MGFATHPTRHNCRNKRLLRSIGVHEHARSPAGAIEPVGNGLREARTSENFSSSTERKSQQTRAQQHHAGCGQREESDGDQIIVAHATPATTHAGPNLLKLYEQATEAPTETRLQFAGLSFRSNTMSRETKTNLVLRHQHQQARSGESWTSWAALGGAIAEDDLMKTASAARAEPEGDHSRPMAKAAMMVFYQHTPQSRLRC